MNTAFLTMDSATDHLSDLTLTGDVDPLSTHHPGSHRPRDGPRLPRPGQRNVLVTSALPYVNNYPHLGNLIGAVLSADVYARFLRQRAVNVLFICGTDEYGTATETKAQQEHLTPRQICDKYHALHRQVYDWFDIAFDEFGRTSTPHQTAIVQEIFWDVYNAGCIAEDAMTQLYCQDVCHRFLADRYVHGTCPNCGYDDARGDQCDNCGRMLNTTELVRPKCATCGNPPVTKATKHLFLDLPKIEPQLKQWVARTSVDGAWSTNSVTLTNTWLRDGLKKRCITRDLKWGVPVPLEGYTDKVFYVWFDAPIGYLSITANYGDRWENDVDAKKGAADCVWRQWWAPAKDANYNVELVQFMGKDNTPFHTIVFPSALLATGKQWTLLHHISTTDYLNYEDGKFSKSRGVGVFGNDAKETGIPTEVWRYYLLLNRPEGSDTTFTWTDLAAKNNDELIKNLGNFINRTVSFLSKFFGNLVPPLLDEDDENAGFIDRIDKELLEYNELMDKVSLKAGLKKAMAISSIGNLYLQTKQPWVMLKEDRKEEAGSSLTFAANLVILVCVVLEPFLGSRFSAKVFDQLGLKHEPGLNNLIPSKFSPIGWIKPGSKTKQATVLFAPLEDSRIKELRTKYAGQQKSSSETSTTVDASSLESNFVLDLRVGRVVQIQDHVESDRLFVAKIDVGEDSGPRTVVAGLRESYKAAELEGRKVVVVCNLVPATLAGIESQGMVLCAEKKKDVKALAVEDSVPVGESLVPVGVPLNLGTGLLDRSSFQLASKLLRVGKDGVIFYNKAHALASSTNPKCHVISSGVPEGGKVK